ncbi:MAG TPA: penicillin acylase family protein [Actinomycetota bacterium]|nr:penicillin acylase family protein [Actinomycetota bacterium]
MRRCLVAILLLCVTAALVPAQVGAQPGPPPVPDTMEAYSIVPPGQEGNVTATEAASGNYGEHFTDQLDLYAKLIETDDVTDGTIGGYFHTMQFGPEVIEEDYSPTEGVTVYRDDFGIPHIYAENFNAASFALGYTTAEDRLWEMDVFRHAARGELSTLVGPDYLEMDIVSRREGYTEEEVQKMYEDFDEKFGALGKKIQDGLKAYADGVNKYISELRTNPAQCPAEYQALGNPCPEPEPGNWTPTDTLFVAVLQLRVFGETAGAELDNAGLYAHLKKKLGPKVGPKVYEDLLRRNDPRSPTTIPASQGRFPSQSLGRTSAKSFAVPDGAVKLARESRAESAMYKEFLDGMGFRAPASNALLVAAKESKSGNPLQIGAPQVGYAVPSFFWEVDVHISGEDEAHFRGPAVPGASALVPLGRGPDYAWSLTTGYSDAVDTKVEKLCAPEGEEVSEDSNHYLFKGECKEMESRTETFIVKPSAGSAGAPSFEQRTFYRTVHGPVFARGKVRGKPVAFVKQRFFWKRELDSIPQFYKWNVEVDSIRDFKAAASKFTMSFNTFYADHKDIGYFHLGFYPKRPKGYHPSLPTWGTGRWEWGGRIPFRRHPKTVNPDQGWVANWNNKPSKGWDNYDGIKWGPIHRVQLLQDQMRRYTAGTKKARLSDLVDVIRVAATQDARVVYLGPKMVRKAARAAGSDEKRKQAVDLVRAWIKSGGHRQNLNWRDGDDQEDNGAAAAIFDAWYRNLVHVIFDDEIGPEDYDLVPTPISGTSMWHDFSSFIANVFNVKARRALARNYCDVITTGKTESCGMQVVAALDAALKELESDQGADMAKWTTDAWWIKFASLGLGSADPIPWQNRGTHNHVVEILRKATAADGGGDGGGGTTPSPKPSGSSSGSASPSPSSS